MKVILYGIYSIFFLLFPLAQLHGQLEAHFLFVPDISDDPSIADSYAGKTDPNWSIITTQPYKVVRFPQDHTSPLDTLALEGAYAQVRNALNPAKSSHDGVVIIGLSHGAGLALRDASTRSTPLYRLKAIIAESPMGITAETLGKATLNTPILIVHSRNDNVVPINSSRLLYAGLVGAGHKKVYLLELADAKHGAYNQLKHSESATKYLATVHALYRQNNIPYDEKLANRGQRYLKELQPPAEKIAKLIHDTSPSLWNTLTNFIATGIQSTKQPLASTLSITGVEALRHAFAEFFQQAPTVAPVAPVLPVAPVGPVLPVMSVAPPEQPPSDIEELLKRAEELEQSISEGLAGAPQPPPLPPTKLTPEQGPSLAEQLQEYAQKLRKTGSELLSTLASQFPSLTTSGPSAPGTIVFGRRPAQLEIPKLSTTATTELEPGLAVSINLAKLNAEIQDTRRNSTERLNKAIKELQTYPETSQLHALEKELQEAAKKHEDEAAKIEQILSDPSIKQLQASNKEFYDGLKKSIIEVLKKLDKLHRLENRIASVIALVENPVQVLDLRYGLGLGKLSENAKNAWNRILSGREGLETFSTIIESLQEMRRNAQRSIINQDDLEAALLQINAIAQEYKNYLGGLTPETLQNLGASPNIVEDLREELQDTSTKIQEAIERIQKKKTTKVSALNSGNDDYVRAQVKMQAEPIVKHTLWH